MRNVLSVDVEDYFQVEAFAAVIPYEHWESYELRVERNVSQILELLARHNVVGTFFVLGWIAERCPKLVRQIVAAGHEVGSHGYAHQRLLTLSKQKFRADLRRSRLALSDQTQQHVRCYRAPSFSIVWKTFWAFDVLVEEGFEIDSSVFPVRHDLYGVPTAERFPHWASTEQGNEIFEFPPSTVRCGGQNFAVGGGGYLRLMPYWLTAKALRHINEVEGMPAMIYLHPWEIDTGQPRIRAGLKSRLRHYTKLSQMYGKVNELLRDFRFGTLSAAVEDCAAVMAAKPGVERVLYSTRASSA